MSKKQKEGTEVGVVEGDELAAAALVKENAAVPTAPVVMSPPQGVEARH